MVMSLILCLRDERRSTLSLERRVEYEEDQDLLMSFRAKC